MKDRKVNISDDVRNKKLTYLGPDKFRSLYDCIASVKKRSVAGDFIEFGVALGGSGICLAKALDAGRRYLGFDVFGMIPPPSETDGTEVRERYEIIIAGQSHGIDGEKYYGYVDNLYDVVKGHFASFGCHVDNKNIFLVKGLFEDTLPLYEDVKVALAHIDCDWYEPVLYCLNYAWPRLSDGGFIVLDDYNDWPGCKKATDEFIDANPGVSLLSKRPHAIIQKRV